MARLRKRRARLRLESRRRGHEVRGRGLGLEIASGVAKNRRSRMGRDGMGWVPPFLFLTPRKKGWGPQGWD